MENEKGNTTEVDIEELSELSLQEHDKRDISRKYAEYRRQHNVQRPRRRKRKRKNVQTSKLVKIAIEIVVLLVFIQIFRYQVEEQMEKRRVRLMIEARLEEQTKLWEEQAEYTLEERQDYVYGHILEHGFTMEAACGMMGNIAVESPDFDPEATGSNGSYGLFQWLDTGGRKDNLKNWCEENGYLYNSLEGQLEFAFYEMEGGDPIAYRLNDYMCRTNDAYTAAVEFAAGFERCVADVSSDSNTYRGSIYSEYYGRSYQALSKRINKAMNFYEHYVSD